MCHAVTTSQLKLNIIHTKMEFGTGQSQCEEAGNPLGGHAQPWPTSVPCREYHTYVALIIIRLENLYILADRLATS